MGPRRDRLKSPLLLNFCDLLTGSVLFADVLYIWKKCIEDFSVFILRFFIGKSVFIPLSWRNHIQPFEVAINIYPKGRCSAPTQEPKVHIHSKVQVLTRKWFGNLTYITFKILEYLPASLSSNFTPSVSQPREGQYHIFSWFFLPWRMQLMLPLIWKFGTWPQWSNPPRTFLDLKNVSEIPSLPSLQYHNQQLA